MMIKAIFFDAAGTLITTAKPVGESYSLLARKYGKEVPSAEITERFRNCFAEAPPLAFPGAEAEAIPVMEREWWKTLVAKIFEPWTPFEGFDSYFSELFAYFARADSWTLYPEVIPSLSELKERRFILGVISNFDSRLLAILDGLGVAHWFDEVLVSSRAGRAKPAAEIFHAALQSHGLEPSEAIHIGDDPGKDASGAAAAGMLGVLVDRRGKYNGDAFLRVRDLREIVPLVDRAHRRPLRGTQA